MRLINDLFYRISRRDPIGANAAVEKLSAQRAAGSAADIVGSVIRVSAMAQQGSGKLKVVVPVNDVFTAAIRRAQNALQAEGYLGNSVDIVVTLDFTDAESVGSSAYNVVGLESAAP